MHFDFNAMSIIALVSKHKMLVAPSRVSFKRTLHDQSFVSMAPHLQPSTRVSHAHAHAPSGALHVNQDNLSVSNYFFVCLNPWSCACCYSSYNNIKGHSQSPSKERPLIFLLDIILCRSKRKQFLYNN